MKVQKLNTETSSKINRSLVLGHIHRTPLISRVELARLTGLDRSTITHILNFLIKQNLVHEVRKGKAGSRGGRCPILLEVNYDAWSIVAIDVGTDGIDGSVTSLKGKEMSKCHRSLKRGEDLIAAINDVITRLRKESKKTVKKWAVIGISCPGVIDTERGIVRLNLFHNWRDVPVAQTLEAHHKIPIFVENDANVAAMGELHQLNDKDVRSLVYLFLRESPPESDYLLGVGGALVLDGRLWHGAHFFAGEIAQTINTLFQNAIKRHEGQSNRRRKRQRTSLHQLLHNSTKPNSTSIQTVDKIADQFGEMLSELVAFLDPEAVMIYLHPPKEKEAFLDKIQEAFYRHHGRAWKSPVKFLSAQLGTHATFAGLVALAQERVFVRDTTHSSWLFHSIE